MKTGWLAKAGPYKIEHLPMPRPGQPVDLKHPPLGLLHTTQGPTIEGALAVFRQHYAPHFTVGIDAKKRGRIVQHVPLGEMAAALMNVAGGVETNREVRVQIEVVGFCEAKLWLPHQPTLSMLAALLAELDRAAGIPLKHPHVARNRAKWMSASGWVGHVDAPENDHTDPGHLNYEQLLQRAAAMSDVGRVPLKRKPKKTLPLSRTKKLKKAAVVAKPHPLCVDTREPAKKPAAVKAALKPKPRKTVTRRRYFTKRSQVKLKKGETIGYVKGRGYYAKPPKKKP